MARLERDGVRIAYELRGEPGPRPPVVLTHGFGESRRMWDSNSSAFARQRLAIAWDLRGHGESDSAEDMTHAACLEDMEAVLELCGSERAVWCGMSLGGFLSLAFWLRHPERVEALILVDTGPGFRNTAARERWNSWARGLDHPSRELLVQEDSAVLDSLGSISVPTLVVVGSEDHRFLSAADVMARRIPGCRKVVIPGAGHNANMDEPEQFNTAITEFLEEL